MLVESAPDVAILADLAVKRRIVAMHVQEIPEDEAHIRDVEGRPFRAEDPACENLWLDASDIECQTLRLLASALSHRPGYQQEWAVDL